MIADILPRYQVTSDGSTVAYTVPFELIENNLVNVYVASEKQSSGYSVNVSTKTITFENAPEEGELITIIRAVPISWEVSDFGSLNEESLNNALTLLTAKMQTLEEEISRSPKTNPYDKETGSDLSELFFTEMRDALDSLERAKVIYTQIQASGTQALADITTEKNSAISDINDNSSDRIGEFNLNATNKTTAFNTNANTVTDTFNQNATNKTDAFNTNAAQKQAAVDASATVAATSAANAATSATNAATSETNAAAAEARINETLSTYVTYVGDPTEVVTLKNKDDQTLIPYTELATTNKPGRVKPDGTTTSVDSNGTITVIGKQDTISSSNPLSADLITSGTTNKVVTQTEKDTWNAKQAALTFDTTPASGSNNPVTSDGIYNAIQNIDALPSQTGQSGKFLTTDGSSASWAQVDITPDNLSITKDSNNHLQAVGTVNKNTATGATNPVYDWVGTLQEYETQQVETLHPDWICYITDDVQGGTSVYTKTEVNNLLSVKANSADVYTKTEVNNLLSVKANSADVYTKTETDSALALKADNANFQVVTALPANPEQGVFYFVVES